MTTNLSTRARVMPPRLSKRDAGAPRHDMLTRQALAQASALLDAAARVDADEMRRLLGIADPEVEGAPVAVAQVIDVTCAHLDVDTDLLLGGRKFSGVVEARHVVAYVSHLLGLTYSEVGRALGVHHTSVMHGVAKVRADDRMLDAAMEVAGRLGYEAERANPLTIVSA